MMEIGFVFENRHFVVILVIREINVFSRCGLLFEVAAYHEKTHTKNPLANFSFPYLFLLVV